MPKVSITTEVALAAYGFSDDILIAAIKKFPFFVPRTLEDTYARTQQPGADDLMESTVAFIRRCLTVDPNKRPTAKELLNDPWLKGV